MNRSGHTSSRAPAHTLADQIAHLKQQKDSLASQEASTLARVASAAGPNAAKSARPVLHLLIHAVVADHSPRQSAGLA